MQTQEIYVETYLTVYFRQKTGH